MILSYLYAKHVNPYDATMKYRNSRLQLNKNGRLFYVLLSGVFPHHVLADRLMGVDWVPNGPIKWADCIGTSHLHENFKDFDQEKKARV